FTEYLEIFRGHIHNKMLLKVSLWTPTDLRKILTFGINY
ncbi:unnamed protein product, partial [Allacma fusca]